MRSKKFRLLIATLVVVVGTLLSTSVASAYCGPGYGSKASAVKYYKTAEGKKYLPSMKKWLVSHGFMHRDQGVMSFLESDSVAFVVTKKGFKFTSNTWCRGFAFLPYDGRYRHSRMGALAVVKKSKKKIGKPEVTQSSKVVKTEELREPQADGSIKVFEVKTVEVKTTTTQQYRVCKSTQPFQKAYCRNLGDSEKYKECKRVKDKKKETKRHEERRLITIIPPPNQPPVVSIVNKPQHVCSGENTDGTFSVNPGQVVLTITSSDLDGAAPTPVVVAVRGNISPLTKVSDGRWEARYTAPRTAGTDTVTATVADGFDHNKDGKVDEKDSVSDSTTFANPKVDKNNPSPSTC